MTAFQDDESGEVTTPLSIGDPAVPPGDLILDAQGVSYSTPWGHVYGPTDVQIREVYPPVHA